MAEILALGDCNTLGVGPLEGNSYPERLAHMANLSVDNCGFTMTTTREGGRFFRDRCSDDTRYLLLQFGLVDSYKTFVHSPYVYYYPDNFLRKQLRSIVKKYKKSCRKWGLNRRFGEKNVVDAEEYAANIDAIISAVAPGTQVVLIETIPNKQLERNKEICRYNKILTELASRYDHCSKIDIYDDFLANFDAYYLDQTHCNSAGYDHIAALLHEQLFRK